MKIFIAHSSSYDFKNNLYIPLRKSKLNTKHIILLPQEKRKEIITKEIIRSCDVLIADVSLPSTGAGIELGWADVFKIPIIYIYKKGSEYSPSLYKLSRKFIAYINPQDLLNKLDKELEMINK
jgi:hypothetical protein